MTVHIPYSKVPFAQTNATTVALRASISVRRGGNTLYLVNRTAQIIKGCEQLVLGNTLYFVNRTAQLNFKVVVRGGA